MKIDENELLLVLDTCHQLRATSHDLDAADPERARSERRRAQTCLEKGFESELGLDRLLI
jgi:hypothetical protein